MIDRSGLVLDLDERFDVASLDETVWLAHYLPHWTTPERSAARYRLRHGRLELRIEQDQPEWAPDIVRGMRVSNLQTGHVAGPLGSAIGQHRTDERLVVRTEHPSRTLRLVRHGVVEARIRVSPDPSCMTALWMIGVEDEPERSAEICIMEVFGRELDARGGLVGVGVHPHHDPRVTDSFRKVRRHDDLSAWHDYAVDWAADRIRFFIDGDLVHTVDERIDYPMQLMLDLFEFPENDDRPADAYPKTASVDRVEVWRRP
ncbi:glycosyl hydrolase family 16 [Diaminobutyricimonas aerilata]|uniref:Glycosyl hydrolase family 16 n=1 Tax=Diaminobutyricimonas aerilata TaxID=1162967 RepID=A0A2M9CL22_9MICO|nr:glycoside hydrolase family 16 protein [Diaminobutyricimonas aerilata]PJJ72559.1 glycosyl hydrolase family 16 [Diaminobutyricimonas aerilata]